MTKLVLLAAMLIQGSWVLGQSYPVKPVRLVTSAVGGSNDFLARLIGQGITGALGQPVIVDNRGIVGIEQVAKAPADGYTLLLYGSPFWIGPLLQRAPYDPLKDFAPVTLMVSVPNLFVVHPSVPVKSIRELIALAKARPGELNYSSASTGSTSHLGAELFKAMAGVNIVHIPYKGGGPALADLLAGQVQITIDGFSLMPHIKAAKLRAIAVTSKEPSSLFPDLPTVASSGLSGYEAVALNGIWAPAGTSAAVINRLNQECVRFLNMPSIKAQLLSTGVESVGSSPEEFAATIQSEMQRWGKVIKDVGIRAD